MEEQLFGQGFNSAAHFGIGAVSGYTKNKYFAGAFIAYQLTEHVIKGPTDRVDIDLAEFGVGVITGLLTGLLLKLIE